MLLPLSLVVITLNEEKNIERCLRSVPFASEIIVVDSGSTDKTVEIARDQGAKVIVEKWRGFGPQRIFASEQAHYDWVLFLDADEALSPELAHEIEQHFAQLDPETVYAMPRKTFHLGRWILHGGWYPDYQGRLYHRKHSHWTPQIIHEKLQGSRRECLKNPLLHWVFANLSHQIQTNDRYSTNQAKDLAQKGQKFSLLKLLVKPPVKFFECYVWKLGFLDGLPGFIVAVGAAYSVFARWAKLWEMQRQ
jgi:glycosyltransferase involved in cell wall biosynthesis